MSAMNLDILLGDFQTAWKVQPSFSLLLIVKCERKKDKLRKELLSKKKSAPEDLKNQSIYIAKDADITNH